MLSNLRNEMWKKKISIAKIARDLKIHPTTLADKINGDSGFWLWESLQIKKNFFPDKDLEQLFENSEPNKGD